MKKDYVPVVYFVPIKRNWRGKYVLEFDKKVSFFEYIEGISKEITGKVKGAK